MEDNRPGRKAPGGPARATGTPSVVPSAPAAQSPPRGTTPRIPRGGTGSGAAARAMADAGSLIADELPDGLVVANDAGRVPPARPVPPVAFRPGLLSSTALAPPSSRGRIGSAIAGSIRDAGDGM